jgi:hypothetical protein
MNSSPIVRRENPFAALRRIAQSTTSAHPVERCEFCSLPLVSAHRHLLEMAARKIVCACDPCALRFENVIGKWKLIPRDSRQFTDFHITDAQWESFSLPIQLAFFFHSTPANKVVAMYPSPAGATESLLTLLNWEALTEENPALKEMQPDVEALLANRLNGAAEYFLAPIDVCFELVGLIRLHWRGFSGGDKVWQEMERFFARLRENSRVIPGVEKEGSHA